MARYADACNFGGDIETVTHRLDILRGHCEAEGRDYNAIHKTLTTRLDPGANGERVSELVDTIGQLGEIGAQTVIGTLIGVGNPGVMQAMGDVARQVADPVAV